MALISPIIEDYRKKHRLRQVGSITGNKSKVVHVPFNNVPIRENAPLYMIPDPTLDGKNAVITGLEIYVNSEQSVLPDYKGGVVDSIPVFSLPLMTFYVMTEKQEVVSVIPMATMCTPINGGKKFECWFEDQLWQNCYIEFSFVVPPTDIYGFDLRVTYFDRYINP